MMTQTEKEEFRNLKYARAEQGFFTAEQKQRWDVLHGLHMASLKEKLQKLDRSMDVAEELKLMRLN